MNNNVRGIRGASQKQSSKNSGIGTRHSSISTPNNNIHININLNVKKKSHCVHGENVTGKKINNFIEVSDSRNQPQGSAISQEIDKHSHQLMKSTAIGKNKFITNKQPDPAKKDEKIKRKKTKQKEKEKVASKPYTPEKKHKGQSEQKSIDKSKTGRKLVKKKQSRSMENIKVFKEKPLHLLQSKKINDLSSQFKENRFKQRSNSSSKQKSREKSGKKLNKNRSSSKNIMPFQNSGIKKVLATEKQTTVKKDAAQNIRKSKKSLKVNKMSQKELIKINEFMEDKKKNDEKKKKEKQADKSTKGIKIKDELLKASREKKQFSSKPEKRYVPHVQSQKKKILKFPIFFGDEQQNHDQQDWNNFQIQRNSHYSNHKTPQKSRVQSKNHSPQGNRKSGTKKIRKESVYDKYQSGKLTKHEIREFKNKVVRIQACWRGFYVRKILLQQISKINKLAWQKKKLIMDKKSEFWDDDENNSIINLEVEQMASNHKSQAQRNQDFSRSRNSNKTPQNSNFNSSSAPTDQIHTNNKKYESQHQNQQSDNKHSRRIRVEDFRKSMEWQEERQTQKKVNEVKKESQENGSNFLVSQIQMLQRQIEEQNKKFVQLQKENSQLKQNLHSVIVEQQKTLKIDVKQEVQSSSVIYNNSTSQPFSPIDVEEESIEIYQLKRPNAQSNQAQVKGQSKKSSGQRFKNLTIQTDNNVPQKLGKSKESSIISDLPSPSNPYVQNLKRQLQSFQSPSNRELKNTEMSGLMNLQRAFKKKELSIEMVYEKSSKMYQQMLQNNIVSPRTYNFKRVQLDVRYQRQKEEISVKLQQAQKVIKYISEEIVPEQRAGDDQSPEKSLNVVEDNILQGVKMENRKQISERIDVSVNVDKVEEDRKKMDRDHQVKKLIQKYGSPQQMNNQPQHEQNNFRGYWTDDIDEVHKRVLEISNKIDQALESDSKYSESLKQDQAKEYSSSNSNFYSLNTNEEQNTEEKDNEAHQQRQRRQVKESIYEQNQYKIAEPKAEMKNLIEDEDKPSQIIEIIANDSNVSSASDKSSRKLETYNIHYPSSPSSQKEHKEHHKHHFQVKNEADDELQASLEGNNSQVSQNRSSYSQMSMQSRPKEVKGFDTRLTFIKEYCIALCQFIRSQDDLKLKFIQNISTPLKYDYFEYLKAYRTTINYQNDTRYNSTVEDYFYPYFKLVKGPIVDKGLNDQNTIRFDQLYNQNYNISTELTPKMQQVRKFFIHAIIDVFNESLNFERPGSIYGEPLPWLVQSRNLKNNHVKYLKDADPLTARKHRSMEDSDSNEQSEEDERLDKIFGIAIAKIIQWGSCLCGFIPESVSFDGEQVQAVNIDQEQTNLVRQTRLAYMLQKSLAEDEEGMIDNTMQQLEVQLEIQQIIFQELIAEAAQEIANMSNR